MYMKKRNFWLNCYKSKNKKVVETIFDNLLLKTLCISGMADSSDFRYTKFSYRTESSDCGDYIERISRRYFYYGKFILTAH